MLRGLAGAGGEQEGRGGEGRAEFEALLEGEVVRRRAAHAAGPSE